MICPKCKNIILRETRQCPEMSGEPVCARCCCECIYYDPENYRCRYHLYHPNIDYEREIKLVEQQISATEIKVRNLYKKNWSKIAERAEQDIAKLMRKKRELERSRDGKV